MTATISILRRAMAAGVLAICMSGVVAAATGGLAPAGAPATVDSQEDIRDIRGPKRTTAGWLVPVLLSTALLALAAYGIWRRRRRETARVLLPFEVALLRLLEIRALMIPARAREFGIAVSDIVRGYIEQRFEVVATQRTTEEFLQDLLTSSDSQLASHRPLLSEFLQQCDIVKFAGISSTMANMEALHESARAFVQETAETAETHDPLPAT
jgi:uncharacterized membrane protein